VTVLERTNARALAATDVGGATEVLVADLSFISLVTVAPAMARISRPDADLVLLVKPQFEAGRARVGKGGIVRDPAVHHAVLTEVVAGLAGAGVLVVDVMPSPLHGADGNIEFLVRAILAADADADTDDATDADADPSRRPAVAADVLAAVVAEAHA
jgi:23S rRNA (cytidine1920-2'-O)/16S rRNA (cytidine1409-2'-O)-methyltransferase